MSREALTNELRMALDGLPGQLDSYLETRNESELKADIRALLGEHGGRERRIFAAMAMQGFCANPAVFAANGMNGWELVNTSREELTAYCGKLADALLTALKETP